jgi:hypothetical protein
MRMLRAKGLLTTLECLPVHGLGLLILTLVIKYCTKVADTGKSIRMLRTKDLLIALECLSVHGLGLLILASVSKY